MSKAYAIRVKNSDKLNQHIRSKKITQLRGIWTCVLDDAYEDTTCHNHVHNPCTHQAPACFRVRAFPVGVVICYVIQLLVKGRQISVIYKFKFLILLYYTILLPLYNLHIYREYLHTG